MPPLADDDGEPHDRDRPYRRAVWVAALVALVAAGVVYADKAADERSAFVRWRPQVLQFWQGVNIYDRMVFPNPPIVPIILYPLMKLPPVAGAVSWFALKAGLTVVSVGLCFRMVRGGGDPLPSYVQAAVLLLSVRPILSDLQHGNNNLVILFLICAALAAWRKGFDVLAGLTLGLAIAYKVTPALFVPYFMAKRSWRTVGSTCLGLALFLVVVPGLILGPEFNGECLVSWWQRMLGPYVEDGVVSAQEVNQSMAGVLTRLLTKAQTGTGAADARLAVNVVSWTPPVVAWLVKGLSVALVGLLAWFCRTRTDRRDDPRLLGEFSLVVLTMLFVSERSWKHHFVTLLIPYTYLAYRATLAPVSSRVRAVIGAALLLSAALMATTSSEFGGLFAGGQGHKVAQGYGMFLWAAVILYAATAWRVSVEGRAATAAGLDKEGRALRGPAPHFAIRRGAVPG